MKSVIINILYLDDVMCACIHSKLPFAVIVGYNNFILNCTSYDCIRMCEMYMSRNELYIETSYVIVLECVKCMSMNELYIEYDW